MAKANGASPSDIRLTGVPVAARLVVVSTYPPRRCGLAAYTKDLPTALSVAAPQWRVEVCAVDRDRLRYGPEVGIVVGQDEPDDYRRAAELIADAGTDLVLIQHEYGIFGGPAGGHIVELTDGLNRNGVPYALTLHTVLPAPDPQKLAVARRLSAGAAVVTVFTETARRLVVDAGLAPSDRVVVVPHGVPPVLRQPVDPARLRPPVRDALEAVGDATLLSTFGLIGPGKGLETAILALPDVVATRPGVRYLIAGATHPDILRTNGEDYRKALLNLARRAGVDRHVLFLDTFLRDEEVAAVLARTDVFVTPYRTREQASSGALTFAVAAGCPAVSTTYQYAEDLLAPRDGDSPGVLVPPDNPYALGAAVTGLLDNPSALNRAREAADALGADLTWPAVANRLVATLRPVMRTPAVGAVSTNGFLGVAPLCLDHLWWITDDTGVIQFAKGSEPDPLSGYCVDDVARLAIVAAGLLDAPDPVPEQASAWLRTALRFLANALGSDGVRNQRDHNGTWLDEPHLGDHVGRAIWGLGAVAASPAPTWARIEAERLLDRLLPLVPKLTWLRSAAYATLGLSMLPTPDLDTRLALRTATTMLSAAQEASASRRWFESRLTYDSARLPQALIAAGVALGEWPTVRSGLRTLDWYLGQVGLDSRTPLLQCIGNRWRRLDEDRPDRGDDEGDEQPLEAAATVEALAAAWQATGDRRYSRLARRAYAWFHGANRAGLPVYDRDTGGCHDGLSAAWLNPNMGAESTLAHHQATLALGALVRRPNATAGRAHLKPALDESTEVASF